jgi:hypothetical protein
MLVPPPPVSPPPFELPPPLLLPPLLLSLLPGDHGDGASLLPRPGVHA